MYDLSKSAVKENDDSIDILENNAKGFFRISEKPENLKKYRIFIQVKSGVIYQVDELKRHETDTNLKSSIRYFSPVKVYQDNEFVEAVITGDVLKSNSVTTIDTKEELYNLNELWKTNYSSMIVLDTEKGETIRINRDDNGQMFRSFASGCIQYNYVDWYDKIKFFKLKSKKDYSISPKKEKLKIWKLLKTIEK